MSDIVDNASPEEFAEMFIESVRETYEDWLALEQQKNPSLKRLPDYEAAIERAKRDLLKLGEIRRIANNILYFNDNSDYETALYQIAVATGMDADDVGKEYIEDPLDE